MTNLFIYEGRLAANPEIVETANGKKKATYRVISTRDYNRDESDSIRVTTWEKAAEYVERNFHKGTLVLVTGSIRTGSYTDKEGKTVYTTDFVANNQEILAQPKSLTKTAEAAPQEEPVEDDSFELPFPDEEL